MAPQDDDMLTGLGEHSVYRQWQRTAEIHRRDTSREDMRGGVQGTVSSADGDMGATTLI